MMNDRLERLFAGLAAEPTDRGLEHFELEVIRTIRSLSRRASTESALAPIGFASVGLALAVGLTVGGAVAARNLAAPRPPSPFAVVANLAPSSLLEKER